jgi:hypothetical protein
MIFPCSPLLVVNQSMFKILWLKKGDFARINNSPIVIIIHLMTGEKAVFYDTIAVEEKQDPLPMNKLQISWK